MSEETLTGQEFWDARYRGSDLVWSGAANAALVREAAGLTPGTALDIGCGEGGDAIWLATRGWRVTAVDVSGVALERAARHAADAGVADRIDFQRHDLAATFPTGVFDLVSSHYLHSPGELPRERILRAAAAAVAPGGVLLIVGHTGFPAWQPEPRPEVRFATTDEVIADLELPTDRWRVLAAEEFERVQNDPEGRPTTRRDNLVKLRRLPD